LPAIAAVILLGSCCKRVGQQPIEAAADTAVQAVAEDPVVAEPAVFDWSPPVLISDEGNRRARSTNKGHGISVDGDSVNLVWSSGARKGDSDIYFKKSTDRGQTWSSAQRLTDAPEESMVPVVTAGGTRRTARSTTRDRVTAATPGAWTSG
jgi:hypothetical protein